MITYGVLIEAMLFGGVKYPFFITRYLESLERRELGDDAVDDDSLAPIWAQTSVIYILARHASCVLFYDSDASKDQLKNKVDYVVSLVGTLRGRSDV